MQMQSRLELQRQWLDTRRIWRDEVAREFEALYVRRIDEVMADLERACARFEETVALGGRKTYGAGGRGGRPRRQ